MGRHKLPDELAELTGAKAKNPGRYSGAGPKPTGLLGRPPTYFDRDQKRCWKELADNCHDGLLANTDRHTLEQAALILAEQRECILWNRSIPAQRLENAKELARRFCVYGNDDAIKQAIADGEIEPLIDPQPRYIRASDKQLYVSLLSRMGMSPVDRNKVALPKAAADEEKDDGFGAL